MNFLLSLKPSGLNALPQFFTTELYYLICTKRKLFYSIDLIHFRFFKNGLNNYLFLWKRLRSHNIYSFICEI